MSTSIISVENLGKRYRLRHQKKQPYATLRGALTEGLRGLMRPDRAAAEGPAVEDFWALRDVNFEVAEGEVVGVIGRNGAGKSTLLKVISRITEPTEGRIRLRGRVASLLEVGTGFHPELTGRENIFLNGAILGMSTAEIRAKFDEIVAFAEVEKFLDTPVKHYSSGMYVRLAFAVAAHLEPEILIVDEVLAVGDAQFQKKCLGKMRDVAEHSGRTVLFVSHNLAAVEHLCSSAIFLQQGRLRYRGSTTEALDAYREGMQSHKAESADSRSWTRPPWAKPVIVRSTLAAATGTPAMSFGIGDPMRINVEFATADGTPVATPCLGVVINNGLGVAVAAFNMRMTGSLATRHVSSGLICCELDDLRLVPGNYTIDLWLGDGMTDIDMVQGALSFDVEPTDFYGSGVPPFAHIGVMVVRPKWRVS
jgi:lipopolysaccharide transport system ATP-binding protein